MDQTEYCSTAFTREYVDIRITQASPELRTIHLIYKDELEAYLSEFCLEYEWRHQKEAWSFEDWEDLRQIDPRWFTLLSKTSIEVL